MARKQQKQQKKQHKHKQKQHQPITKESIQVVPEFNEVSIFKTPILSIQILLKILVNTTQSVFQLSLKYIKTIALIFILVSIFILFEGPHSQYRQTLTDIIIFAAYWIILGVASSIGLGTGLHTFVLYLGPHIAQVTLAANQCNEVPRLLPSRWRFQKFEACDLELASLKPPIGFWTIYQSVCIEAFLWGLGTAIGELPPYFVARAASLAGSQNDELNELLQETNNPQGFVAQAKQILFKFLKQNAFIAVTFAASIPNPLFDVAGLTCGHLQIPFSVFFLSTFIGKAINKVSLQTFFIIFAFSKHLVFKYIQMLDRIWPKAATLLQKSIDAQNEALFANQNDDPNKPKPMFVQVWDKIITLMILYFLVSFLNSIIRNYLKQQYKEKHN